MTYITSYTHPDIAKSIRYGERGEQLITEILTRLGHKVTPSTLRENIDYDIDAYVDGVPTSFKTHQKKYSHLGFLFETKRYSKKQDSWYASWYYTGRATQYIVLKPREDGTAELFLLKKEDVQHYEQTRGWDNIRNLLPETLREQAQHNQSNTVCGSINKRNSLVYGVAKLLIKVEDVSI